MKTYQQLLEEVQEQNRISIPDTLRFASNREYRKPLEQIISQLDSYHRTKDEDELKRVSTLCLRMIETMVDDMIEMKLSHQHEVRLLKSKLSSFTKIKKQKMADPENELKKLLDK